MNFDKKTFDLVKYEGENLYKTFGSVYCPYFKDTISFNTLGLHHLKFHNHTRPRSKQDQYMRFRLLYLAPIVLKTTSTLQGVFETGSFERIRVHSRTDTILKMVTYFEFIAIVCDVRAKIIVKQIGRGQKFFWSIIPYWGTDKNDGSRKLYNGHPVED